MKKLILFVVLLSSAIPIHVATAANVTDGKIMLSSACEYDYPPFCIVDENDQATGFSVELLSAALAMMNRDVTFQVGSWVDIKDLLSKGRIDVLPLVGRTPERESIFDFTFPYLSLHGTIVVGEATDNIHSLSDLRGHRVAVMAGDNAEEYLHRIRLEAEIIATPTFEVALRGLSEGKYDAVIIQRLLALRLIQEKKIDKLKIIKNPLEDLRQDFCFAVEEGDYRTLSLLNEGLALIVADGTLARLQRKWFAPLELPSSQKIVMGTEDNFPPYSFSDKLGNPSGYNVDLAHFLSEISGVDIEIRMGPWKDIRQALDIGEIDAIVGMFQSDEREDLYDFSPPFAVIQHGIFAHENSPPVRTEADLKGKAIIVMAGDIMHDYVVENGLSDNPILAATISDALELLATGQYDYALTAQYASLHWINELDLTTIKQVGPLLLPSKYSLAIKDGDDYLLQLFTEGLGTLNKTGRLKELNDKWFSILSPQGIPIQVVLKYILYTVAPLLFLLLLSILWTRTLKRKIQERTQELDESKQILQSSEKKFRLLADYTHDWEYWLNPDGEYIYVSPSCERITGYKPDAFQEQPDLILSLVHENFKAELVDHYKSHNVQNNSLFRMEFLIRDKQGEEKWIEHHCAPVFDDQGIYAGRRASNRDISVRKHAEIAQADSDRLRALLLDIITHDLKNPAGVIYGMSQMAQEKAPDDELIENIYLTSGRLLKVLENTTILAQATFGENIPMSTLDLNAMLTEIASEFSSQLKLQGMNLKLDIPKGIILHANPLISEVFKNYISNAIKYSKSGKEILVEALIEKESVVICVKDFGTTIPKADRKRIFERSVQLEEGRKQGRGLGLAIVKRIAVAHGGTAWVEPNSPQGNSFCLRIPA